MGFALGAVGWKGLLEKETLILIIWKCNMFKKAVRSFDLEVVILIQNNRFDQWI